MGPVRAKPILKLAATVVGSVAVVVVLVALLARFVLHGPVTPTSLFTSVAHEADSALDAGRCRPVGPAWDCIVTDRQGSGSATYRVLLRHGGSCWAGPRTREDSPVRTPRRVEGCVRLWQ